MKTTTIVMLLVSLAFSLQTFAQERYLLTPFGEAIPVEKGKSVHRIVRETAQASFHTIISDCPSVLPVGRVYHPSEYNTNFGYNAGDVAAMIYIVPFTGVIESVYFATNSNGFSNLDAELRIYKVLPGWGTSTPTYFGACPDSNDTHTGRTPWPDEATGPCDHFLGDRLWGLDSFYVTWPNSFSIQGVRMFDLGYEPSVTAGDTIAICLRKFRFEGHPDSSLAVLRANNQPWLPFRFVKYYDHGRLNPAEPGWWSREFDMYIWVVMRPANDLPPIIQSFTILQNTTSTGPQTVCLTAFDCNPSNPSDTGVVAAQIVYNVNGGAWDTVSMSFTPGVGWCGDIPGQDTNSTVTYRVRAIDNHGLASPFSSPISYRVVGLDQGVYMTDFPTYNFIDITTTGIQINPASFFPNGNNNDGTAGPFDLGGTFRFFGQGLTTAWVGVNGALSLSASPIDTINLNAGGFFANWTIPQPNIARNFISVFWNDLYLSPGGHGSVWHKVDGTRFIVQWNRVGNFNSASDTTTTFEIILDRADSSITFQYADVGTTGLEFQNLTGLQELPTDPPSAWLFLNRFGYPDTTRAVAGKAMRMKLQPIVGVHVEDIAPVAFALHPNYPNPFNPITKIRYELPRQVNVTLTVFNMLGQEVATLVNEMQQAGKHEVEFYGEGLASGVYFYRLQAGNYIETKKLVLLK